MKDNRFDKYYYGEGKGFSDGYSTERIWINGIGEYDSISSRTITLRGILRVKGDISAESISGDGILECSGDLLSKNIELRGEAFSGSAKCNNLTFMGKIKSGALSSYETISVRGETNVSKVSSGNRIDLEGIFKIERIEGEEVLIYGAGTIGSVKCRDCSINDNARTRIRIGIRRKLEIGLLESRGMLTLSNCHVKKVIANNVTLHDDATVDDLEVSGTVNRV
jgi:cytoskeletal protein CcmA (bactofilin family)